MNEPSEGRIEFAPTASMRLHPIHKEHLPKPDVESPEWHGFVDSLSGAGPEGIPPLFVVRPSNAAELALIVDGGRRWTAAKQLGWEEVPVSRRPEEFAAVIMLESLIGQRHLTKGAKVYLTLGFMVEFVESAESRRLANLRRGVKTLEKALKFPKGTECPSGKGWEEIGGRLGACERLVKQAAAIRRLFTAAAGHKFEFQDGSTKTLKQHFEPRLLDTEHPMGLGEVLKGCGWFVDENGKPKVQAGPAERNSHLHYFESAWAKFNGQFAGRWEKLGTAGRARAVELVRAGVREWPEEVREELGAAIREAKRK